ATRKCYEGRAYVFANGTIYNSGRTLKEMQGVCRDHCVWQRSNLRWKCAYYAILLSRISYRRRLQRSSNGRREFYYHGCLCQSDICTAQMPDVPRKESSDEDGERMVNWMKKMI
ncbi:hypothetical protein PMAYCL1PPCAC_05698, partial [Pristionchus mayeri]